MIEIETNIVNFQMEVSSIEKLKQFIERDQASYAIEFYTDNLQSEENKDRQVAFYLNRALAKLSIQMVSSSIADCNYAIQIEPTSFAYLIQGVAYLWLGDDFNSVNSLQKGLDYGGPISYYTLMQCLVCNHNLRTHLYSLEFKVNDFLNFIDEFDPHHIYDDSDTQHAFSELRNNSLNHSIAHFNVIISNNKHNIQAYRGRGIASVLVGQWKRAIDDLTIVIDSQIDISECCKYRAIAHASLGQYTCAIIDLSTAISRNPNDFEAIIERAKLQMLRRYFTLALNDFRSVPERYYDSKIFTLISECFYAIGDIPHASHSLTCAFNNNSNVDYRTYYISYLIRRDQGHIKESITHLMKALELMPSFFLYRTAADYMYECGNYKNSVLYYKNSLNLKQNDADTLLMYSLSLLQSSNEYEALKILKILSEASNKQSNDINICQMNYNNINVGGDLFSFDNSTPLTLKSSLSIYKTLINLINNKDKEISVILTNDNNEMKIKSEINLNEFHFINSNIQYTKIEKKMISDADRLGLKCLPFAPEVISNPRIIRCLGFSVLYLTYQMKNNYFINNNISWIEALKPIQIIMSYADLHNDIKWVHENKNYAPKFYLHHGERRSPRFGVVIKNALNIIKNDFVDELENCNINVNDNFEMTKIPTFENVYSLIQEDYIHFGKWDTKLNIELATPTIHLNYLGANGFDLFLMPPLDENDFKQYTRFLQKAFSLLLERTNSEMPVILSLVILVIWLMQPLSHFSVELGNIIFHAYLLASRDLEVERLPSSEGEMFIKQFVKPSLENLNKNLTNHLNEKAVKANVDKESLDFWKNLPTVEKMFQLLEFNAEKDNKVDDV